MKVKTSGIYNSVLETIGGTPLIRLQKVAASHPAAIFAKAEFFNPGGSVKDRVGLRIVEEYEKAGLLQPGGTIVEATSGNTGMGLALAAAVKGYQAIIVTKSKTSVEKVRALEAVGAKVIIVPSDRAADAPDSYYNLARRIAEEIPGAILANQYHNSNNPQAHFLTTGPEIWDATEGRVTHFVAGLGTGGTVSGTGRFLKEQNPNIKVIGLDPSGSILRSAYYTGRHERAGTSVVEGVGQDCLPSILDFDCIDEVLHVDDQASMAMTRRLAREEGLLCGMSSGFAVVGALQVAESAAADSLIVVLLPDDGFRYLSKVHNDEWLQANGFDLPPLDMSHEWMQEDLRDTQAIHRFEPLAQGEYANVIG